MKILFRIILLIFVVGVFAISPAIAVTAEDFPPAAPEPAYTYVTSSIIGTFLSSDTPEPTPTARRPTHTPEPVEGAESTPTSEAQTEDQSRLGYYIALGVLGTLMLLNRFLGRAAKRNRQK